MRNLDIKISVNGQEQPVQIKDFMTTSDYFQMTIIDNPNKHVKMKEICYHTILCMVINPKLSKEILDELPWHKTLLMAKKIQEIEMPKEIFLDLGVQPDDIPQLPES